MRIFVDTSAFYNLLDADAEEHPATLQTWQNILAGPGRLYTTNYIVVETIAIVQNRLHMAAAIEFVSAILPLVTIHWVDAELHKAGVEALLAANRRPLSLVDCVSFAACRLLAVDRVFAYDRHFVEQGFQVLD